MPGNRHSPRMDAIELKVHIERRLGQQKSEKYFNLLNKYLSLKLSKSKFDKLCIELLGRENVSLHNGLIRSIITNACTTKIPPPKRGKSQTSLNVKVPNGQEKSSLQPVFPQSPRTGRTHKFKDQPSQLGPHKLHNVACDVSIRKVPEPSGPIQKVLEHQTAIDLLSVGSVPPVEEKSVEEGEEVEQDSLSPCNYDKAPLRPPFGVSLNKKGIKKVLPLGKSHLFFDTCNSNGELPDMGSLRTRLEQKLATEGINVSTDCVNLLNNGLDSFIKRLIKPCLNLAKSSTRGANKSFSASMTDFRVTMDSNPRILGEDWPEKLEKVMEG